MSHFSYISLQNFTNHLHEKQKVGSGHPPSRANFSPYKHFGSPSRVNSVKARQSEHAPISYPESSGSLVCGLVARRDSGEMEFFPQKSGVPVVVHMLSFIKTEVNVSREVGMLDESLDGNQKS